jgi:hypothetical protein
MKHVLAFLGVVLWFGLNAALWYLRPSDAQWLLGSLTLAILGALAFFHYVMRR